MPSKSPVSVPFTFLGETQCVSQVMICERWSIHPIPKLKERNLENSISIRFLDDNTALIDVDSSVWEITAILGHPDNDRLYFLKNRTSYTTTTNTIIKILAEETSLQKGQGLKMIAPTVWEMHMVLVVGNKDGVCEPLVVDLPFEVSLVRILHRIVAASTLPCSSERQNDEYAH